MERVQVTPRSFPTNLIDKDWANRKHLYKKNSDHFLSLVHDMKLRDDDVWVVTRPKCGTTWMQELSWLLLNNFDFAGALAKDQELRSPYLEFGFSLLDDVQKSFGPVEELKSPRLIKSHLPLALLPSKLWEGQHKVIYVFRNPLDHWVSLYYHGVTFGFNYGKTLHQYFDEVIASDDFATEIIEHAHEFYQLRNEPWVFYTSFERMKKDLRGVINEVSSFLNKPVDEQQMEKLLKHLSFEEMKKNPTTNHLWELAQIKHINARKEEHPFVRRGNVNGYKDELTPEQIDRANISIQRILEKKSVTMDELLLQNVL
ncbi:sulfotransferase 1E1-like [Drosophila subpulchrella]|uniref:sulfotransferase 1E1-like n=1 Tax=Drosophila subpulchrella TaxID=1486046 RepID=UPI0018A16C2F|nr:sulfotransferase 1E1-like [Drosophila subpulchrella]XP_037728006.1 sulfotransferase 1E1-like [Drosophila subpulchrella]